MISCLTRKPSYATIDLLQAEKRRVIPVSLAQRASGWCKGRAEGPDEDHLRAAHRIRHCCLDCAGNARYSIGVSSAGTYEGSFCEVRANKGGNTKRKLSSFD